MDKKKRYTPTEFIGLNEIESIILKYKWIFRRQSNPDVGIDVQIEMVDDGYPTAKFIAVQVKKGTSNFYLNSKRTKASYYAKPEHYLYWIDSSIPVFIMGLLDDGKLYWQYASDKSLYTKLSETYRLDIPLKNVLNLEHKKLIESISLGHLNQLNVNEERSDTLNSVMEYNSEINYVLKDFNETILNISNYIQHYTKRTSELGQKGNDAVILSQESQVKIRKTLIKKYTLQVNALTNRLKSEANMSKEYFEEIKVLMKEKRKILKHKIEDKILESFLVIPKYEEFCSKLTYAITNLNSMNNSIQEHPSYDLKFRKSKRNSKSTFKKIINLLTNIKNFIEEEKNYLQQRTVLKNK